MLRARMSPPVLVETAYVVAVATIATFGFASDSPLLVVIAALMALPVSGLALPAYYVAYGLLALTPGANPSHGSGVESCAANGICRESSIGDPATWFLVTADIVGILALTTAALLNVLLLRRLVAVRRARARTRAHP